MFERLGEVILLDNRIFKISQFKYLFFKKITKCKMWYKI